MAQLIHMLHEAIDFRHTYKLPLVFYDLETICRVLHDDRAEDIESWRDPPSLNTDESACMLLDVDSDGYWSKDSDSDSD